MPPEKDLLDAAAGDRCEISRTVGKDDFLTGAADDCADGKAAGIDLLALLYRLRSQA